MENEKWILGYRFIYKINSNGIVTGYHDNRGGLLKNGYIVKPTIKSTGYLGIKLFKNGVRKCYSIHRLLAIMFIPNPHKKPCVNHIDGNKLNNSLKNLEWCTIKENNIHAYKNNLCKRIKGQDSHNSKITNDIAIKIFNENGRHIDLAKKYNLYPATIGSIKCGRSWSHITGKVYIRKRKL